MAPLAWVAAASPSIGATPASEPGQGFDVIAYQLALAPDVANKTVVGHETILLRTTADGVQRLSFSGNALSIDRALIEGVAIEHRQRAGGLDFELPEPFARGRLVKLELDYHGRPARGFAGSGTSLYTSYFACDWMICTQDRFGDKADFSLDLRVPAGMSSLSLGRMVEKTRGPGGTEIHKWRSPRPYSAYLYGFALGRFARDGDEIGSAKLTYLSDAVDAPDLRRRLAETRKMVAFLSAKAGVGLPVPEYSQLLVDGDEAQEAATYSVLGVNAVPTNPDDPERSWAVVHELAHQWWGNLVTCKTLQDFWLNEGITTFMTAAWKEHRFGRAAYDAELEVAGSRLDKARALGFDKPLTWAGAYPTLATRRAVQYSKGALFMAQLRATLGDTTFWSGLRRYTRAHAGSTVTSIDLERAMEAASGRDLHPLFAEWVFGADEVQPRPAQ